MGSSRFGLNVADKESRCIPHTFPRSHWLKTTGQCVINFKGLPVGDNGWSETPNSGLLVALLKHLRDTNMPMSDKIRRDFEKCYCCAIISIHGTKINTN